MKVLFGILAVAALVAVGDAQSSRLEVGFRVKFASNVTREGTDAFFDIPRTVTAARSAGYTQSTRPNTNQHFPSLVLYCPSVPEVCGLYDDTGYVAGLQIAISRDNFTTPFDMTVQGWTTWTAPNGRPYWTITEYFVNEQYLATAANQRVANRDNSRLLQLNGVWVAFRDQLQFVSSTPAETLQQGFTLQGCMAGMGLHYFYQMTAQTQCDTQGIYPWFTLYLRGNLIGIGMITAGRLPLVPGRRDVFERAPGSINRIIAPNGPSCLASFFDTNGAISMHTYFIDRPTSIVCPAD